MGMKLVSQKKGYKVLLSKDNSRIVFFSFISFRLNYVVVRPAIIYGLADRQGLSTLLHMYDVG